MELIIIILSSSLKKATIKIVEQGLYFSRVYEMINTGLHGENVY